jgi:hypothetical protein
VIAEIQIEHHPVESNLVPGDQGVGRFVRGSIQYDLPLTRRRWKPQNFGFDEGLSRSPDEVQHSVHRQSAVSSSSADHGQNAAVTPPLQRRLADSDGSGNLFWADEVPHGDLQSLRGVGKPGIYSRSLGKFHDKTFTVTDSLVDSDRLSWPYPVEPGSEEIITNRRNDFQMQIVKPVSHEDYGIQFTKRAVVRDITKTTSLFHSGGILTNWLL